MIYPLFALSLIVLAILVDFLLRTHVAREASTWNAMLPLAVMTLIADWVLTALPIVRYNHALLSGLHIGPIPIEDFSYVVVAVILTKSFMRFYERHH